jgi:hypothetical protein
MNPYQRDEEYPIHIYDPFPQSNDYFDYPEDLEYTIDYDDWVVPESDFIPESEFEFVQKSEKESIPDFVQWLIPESANQKIFCSRCEQAISVGEIDTHRCLPFVECPRCGSLVKHLEDHQRRNKRCKSLK